MPKLVDEVLVDNNGNQWESVKWIQGNGKSSAAQLDFKAKTLFKVLKNHRNLYFTLLSWCLDEFSVFDTITVLSLTTSRDFTTEYIT